MVQHIGYSRQRNAPDNSELLNQLKMLKGELDSLKSEYKTDMQNIALDIVEVDSKITNSQP